MDQHIWVYPCISSAVALGLGVFYSSATLPGRRRPSSIPVPDPGDIRQNAQVLQDSPARSSVNATEEKSAFTDISTSQRGTPDVISAVASASTNAIHVPSAQAAPSERGEKSLTVKADKAILESSDPQNITTSYPIATDNDFSDSMVRSPAFMLGALPKERMTEKKLMPSPLKERPQQQIMGVMKEKLRRKNSRSKDFSPNADFIELSDEDDVSHSNTITPRNQWRPRAPTQGLIRIKKERMSSSYGEVEDEANDHADNEVNDGVDDENDNDADDEDNNDDDEGRQEEDEKEEEEEGDDEDEEKEPELVEHQFLTYGKPRALETKPEGVKATNYLHAKTVSLDHFEPPSTPTRSFSAQKIASKSAKTDEASDQSCAPYTNVSKSSATGETSETGHLSQSFQAHQDNSSVSPPIFRVPRTISISPQRSQLTKPPAIADRSKDASDCYLSKKRTAVPSSDRAKSSRIDNYTDCSTTPLNFRHDAGLSASKSSSKSSQHKVRIVIPSPTISQRKRSRTTVVEDAYNNYGIQSSSGHEDKIQDRHRSDEEDALTGTMADNGGDGSPDSDHILRSMPPAPDKIDLERQIQASICKKTQKEVKSARRLQDDLRSIPNTATPTKTDMTTRIESSIAKKNEHKARLEEHLQDLRNKSPTSDNLLHNDLGAQIQSSIAKKQQDKLKMEGNLRGILKNSSGNAPSKKRDHARFAEENYLGGECSAPTQANKSVNVSSIGDHDTTRQSQISPGHKMRSDRLTSGTHSKQVSPPINGAGAFSSSPVRSLSPSELTPIGTRTPTSIRSQRSPTPIHPEYDDYDFTTLLTDFDVSDIIENAQPVRRKLFPSSLPQKQINLPASGAKQGECEEKKYPETKPSKSTKSRRKSRKKQHEKKLAELQAASMEPEKYAPATTATEESKCTPAARLNNHIYFAEPTGESISCESNTPDAKKEPTGESQEVVEARKLRRAEKKRRRQERKATQGKYGPQTDGFGETAAATQSEPTRETAASTAAAEADVDWNDQERQPEAMDVVPKLGEINERQDFNNLGERRSTGDTADEETAWRSTPTINQKAEEDAPATAGKKRRHDDETEEDDDDQNLSFPKYRRTSHCAHSIARGPGQPPILTGDAEDLRKAIKGMYILQNGIVQLSERLRPVADNWRSYAEALEESTGYNFVDAYEYIKSSVGDDGVLERMSEMQKMKKVMREEVKRMTEEDALGDDAVRKMDCDCVWE